MNRYVKFLLRQEDLVISFIPSILFMVVYKFFSFKIALITGLLLGSIIYGYKFLKSKKLTILNILGIIGLSVSTLLGLLTNNPKTIFLYPVISYLVYAVMFIVSYFMQNDIVSSVAKSFIGNDEVFSNIRPALRSINLIWGGYYLIRVILKLIMLKVNTSFDMIYSINWFMGYPVFISLYLLSYKYSEWYYLKSVKVETKIQKN